MRAAARGTPGSSVINDGRDHFVPVAAREFDARDEGHGGKRTALGGQSGPWARPETSLISIRHA